MYHPFVKNDFREDSSLFGLWNVSKKEYSFDELEYLTMAQYSFLLAGKVYENALANPTSTDDKILRKRMGYKYPQGAMSP